ncbi:hypothetical protein V3C99_013079 [Haemonchus contortus]
MPWEVYEPHQCAKFFGSVELLGPEDEDTGVKKPGSGSGPGSQQGQQGQPCQHKHGPGQKCDKCQEGQHQHGPGQKCETCQRGQPQAGPGHKCETCQRGQAQAGPGHKCETCQRGQPQAGPGHKCETCQRGQPQAGPGERSEFCMHGQPLGPGERSEYVKQEQHQHGPGQKCELCMRTQHQHGPGQKCDLCGPSVRSQPSETPSQARTRKAICVKCKEPVNRQNPGCKALNQIFHVKCYTCKKCSKPLVGLTFYNIDNSPTCSDCYNQTLDNCAKCHEKITDKMLKVNDLTYHVQCFTCKDCQKSLDGVPFTGDKENVYCIQCFQNKTAPHCAVCKKPIVPREGEKETKRVFILNKSFHLECFKCEHCSKQLNCEGESGGCYPLNDHIYCKDCNVKHARNKK